MIVSPYEVYDIANFHGYGFTGVTLIGRHAVYGSSFSSRLLMSSLAHGSSGSSPSFNPPSRSMLPLEPPPTQGPVRSTLPSGRRGIGWLLTWASGTTGLPPTWI